MLRKGEKPKLPAKDAKVNRSSIHEGKHKQKVSRNHFWDYGQHKENHFKRLPERKQRNIFIPYVGERGVIRTTG